MKTINVKPGAIKIIQIITLIFDLQINCLFAAVPIEIDPLNHSSICVICSNSASSTQKDILFSTIVSLAPNPPAEATFTDEAAYTEINLAPSTPAEALFDNDPEIISPSVHEYLAPKTPEEADFND